MSFTYKILLGLLAGVAVGLFLGEHAVALKWAADGFVKLLQMTVLPYVTLSILTSLGSLNYAQARRLGVRAGAVLVVLWAVRPDLRVPHPARIPRDRECDVLQHLARRAAAAVQFHRSVHPVESFPFAGQ